METHAFCVGDRVKIKPDRVEFWNSQLDSEEVDLLEADQTYVLDLFSYDDDFASIQEDFLGSTTYHVDLSDLIFIRRYLVAGDKAKLWLSTATQYNQANPNTPINADCLHLVKSVTETDRGTVVILDVAGFPEFLLAHDVNFQSSEIAKR